MIANETSVTDQVKGDAIPNLGKDKIFFPKSLKSIFNPRVLTGETVDSWLYVGYLFTIGQ